MLRSFISLLFLLTNHSVFSQTTLRGVAAISANHFLRDSIEVSPNKSFNKKIKIRDISNSKYKIEIRLYTDYSLSNTKSLRRIYLVDTIWKADAYDEQNNPVAIKKYKLYGKPSFDSLIIKLLSFNIMSLPNQSELKTKMRKDTVEVVDGEYIKMNKHIMVTDGESYTVEIKVGKDSRIYGFDNPESYAKFYDNVKELKDYVNIIRTFNSNLSNSR